MDTESQKPYIPTMKKLLYTLSFVLAVALGALLWQWNILANLNKEVSTLKDTQIPQRQYVSYDDCINNGGATLNTIATTFNACLGGNTDESGENPQYQAFLQYSAQNLPRIQERKVTSTSNRVDTNSSYSTDLIAFLKSDYTGCMPRGEYAIIKEVKERFALIKYGCDGDGQVQSISPPTIIAMKLSDGWSLLSPTNNMNGEIPSCLLVDMFKISKKLTPKCFENTGYNDGELRGVSYQ